MRVYAGKINAVARAAGQCSVQPSTRRSFAHLCLECRRVAGREGFSRTAINPSTKHFSTSRYVRKSQGTASGSSQRSTDSGLPETHFDFFPETFPNGPPPNASFTPDLKQLRKEFLQLQAKAHPDLAPADQKRHAEALSMRINEAYKTLQDPLRRAQYLLLQNGIDVEDESAKLSENELLMEVMEAREAVDEVQEESDLIELREENDRRIQSSVQVLDEAFAQNDLPRAAQEAIRLRYWMNIEESIVGWEKGKGGGAIHH